MDGILPASASQRPRAEDLGHRLADALAAGGAGLRLDLQPICAAASLDPVGYEALLRWEHPDLGAITARETLAAAEAVGRGVALDAWVLVQGFRLRAGWPAGGPYLALNVSAGGILAGHAAPMVKAALDATGVDPRGLSLELPEAAVARDLEAARSLGVALRGLGISLALDDFGGTHGSARVLRDIPFAAVKRGGRTRPRAGERGGRDDPRARRHHGGRGGRDRRPDARPARGALRRAAGLAARPPRRDAPLIPALSPRSGRAAPGSPRSTRCSRSGRW